MKVSIIIPVYNVEKFLDKCIESAISQTYRNIEIILVDDGSTDSSGSKCDTWKSYDNRIKVIHKNNGGLSSARNIGIDNATGESIFFLDSDDYLAKQCIEHCVELLKNVNADISIVQMKHINEEINVEISNKEITKKRIYNSEEAIRESLYQTRFSCNAPAKLYKREVIGNIRFPEGRLNEDLAVCHYILSAANVIVYSNQYGYYYRQRNNSIMHSFNPKRLDALRWMQNLNCFCKKKYPSLLKATECRTFNVSVHLLLDLPSEGELHDKYFELIWRRIKKTRRAVLLNYHVRFREKAAAVLSFGGEKVLKKVWNSRFALKK